MADARADAATNLEHHLSNLAPRPIKTRARSGQTCHAGCAFYATSVLFRGSLLERQGDRPSLRERARPGV
eukprot:9495184-Pyramimonas_sp.AAC.1